ncbi:EAL domain-containing protein [uncultured Desulfobulbus sp.]|uniref:EAL domain-containing protein n=1 Tax=uncultured Desulfobulbus sp. TaxID=239745 RepID=UPI0029C5FC2A|nr:EAL domain-containing protein [uncultured Desulfobulbus sp.]
MITVSKTLLSYTLFLLVPLFAVLAAGGHLAGNHLADRLEQEARDNAASVQHMVEAATKASFEQMLRSVAENNLTFLNSLHQKHQAGALSLDEAKWLALETLAAQTVGRSGYIFSFDSQGVLQGHPDKALVNTVVNRGLLERLQQLKPLEQGEYLGYLIQDSRKQQPLALFKAVFAPWDWTIALICSANDQHQMVPLATLATTISGLQFAGGLRPFFLDQSGLFRPNGSVPQASVSEGQNALPLLAAALRRQHNGSLTWPLLLPDQTIEDRVFVFQYLAANDMIVGVCGSRAELYQPLATFRLYFLLTLLTLFLGALAAMPLLYQRQNKPLRRFAQDMALTDAHSSEVHTEAGHHDLTLIAAAFNRLLTEFRCQRDELEAVQIDADLVGQRLRQELISRKETRVKLRTEITTRKSAEKYLLLFKGIFDNAIEGIYITDPEARILTVNHSFSEITGYQPAEVIGHHPSMLGSGQQSHDFYQRMWRNMRQNGSWSGEIWNQKKDGTICPQWLSISVIKNDQQQITHYFAFFHDITELKRKEKQISVMAYSDALTRLPNRSALERRLAKSIARAARDHLTLAVFFIDLDNFKNVNDSLGHDKGDQVLIEVANRLSQTIRSEDTLSRLGGDEFILLSESIENETAVYTLANRILAALQQPIVLKPNTIYINASIGISIFPDDGQTTQELIKNADMAMYKAKSEGKNKFVMFTQEMNEKLLNHIRIENSIRTGLKLREFSVFYQPKIDVESEQPTSFEALIRWRKNNTIIGPDQFISIAEESGLIDEMSLYVLDEVCIFLSKLQGQNVQVLPISVNMSPRTFNNLNIVETIDAILGLHHIDHHLIEFEITETTAMKDVQHTLATMQRFRQRGIRFSIDDFGTGYSSLSYLSEMPVSTLKIDKRFINAGDANSRSIASTITAMSKQMRLKVVAEGVETRNQLQWVRGIGCDEVQGFYFSRPMPEQDTLLYLQAGLSASSQGILPLHTSIH